jgi:hypothetical protein
LKKIFSIKAENVAAGNLLVIRLGNGHFSYAVCSGEGKVIDELGYYTLSEALDENSLMQIYQQEDALRHQFDNTRIGLDFAESVMVPAMQASNFPARAAIELQYGQPGPVEYRSETIRGWQLNNHYAVPAGILQWLQTHFANALFTQGYSADLCRVEGTDFEGALSLDFRAEEFTVIASRSNKLLLTQTYPYENPADVLYYLLRLAQEFGFSQQEVRVYLSGLIEKESSLYRELYQYFIHVRFREAAWQFPDSSELLPAHYFAALYDLAQCG